MHIGILFYIHAFRLNRLNKNLVEIKGRVIGTKPPPSLREALLEVRREKSQKKVMMGSHESATSLLKATADRPIA